jgi:hypothetical protein
MEMILLISLGIGLLCAICFCAGWLLGESGKL